MFLTTQMLFFFLLHLSDKAILFGVFIHCCFELPIYQAPLICKTLSNTLPLSFLP